MSTAGPGLTGYAPFSLSGIEAGRAGRFGFVIRVDRVGQAAALRAHGADTVVHDLAELLEPS
ncbi:MAG: hypothetical protein ACOH2F_08465 [Cellulomonas sp.]